MATYAIGDIQGCLRQFDALLEKLNFSALDELWLAGDLINRGPESLQLLRRVKALSSQCEIVLGNHDLHFLAILFGGHKAGAKDTFADLLQAPDVYEIGHWLRKQKLAHQDNGHIMVHAGIPGFWASAQAFAYAEEVEAVIGQAEGITLAAGEVSYKEFFSKMYGNEPPRWDESLNGMDRLRIITNYFTRMRYVDAACTMNFAEKGGIENAPVGFMPWFEQAPEQKGQERAETILFGHWASLNGVTHSAKHIALDTGCVWGRFLTAYCLETGEVTRQSAH
jgi:bis(5'-nucleosyl)-tetraphosphatase (symmetrical)|tara:strand:+ start:3832 stop:4671 length:840 start_codon:yes stop_codon:yes gene_type:complete